MTTESTLFIVGLFPDDTHRTEYLYRLAWFLQPHLDHIANIYIRADAVNTTHEAIEVQLDPALATIVTHVEAKLVTVSTETFEIALINSTPETDVLLLANESEEAEHSAQVDRFRATGRFYRLYQHELSRQTRNALWMGTSCWTQQDQTKIAQITRLEEAYEHISNNDTAHIIGPDLTPNELSRTGFKSPTVVLTSTLLPELARLDKPPHLLIFANDAEQHSGPSAAAAKWRSGLILAMQLHNSHLICAIRDVPLFEHLLPSETHRRILGVHINQRPPSSNPLHQINLDGNARWVTELQMHIATTFTRHVEISGFAQDTLACATEELAENRPGDHATLSEVLQRNLDLERALSRAEAQGLSIKCLTQTTAAPLHHRQPNPTLSPKRALSQTTLGIIDPDAKGQAGHFLSYDRRLAGAAKKAGLNPVVLSNTDLVVYSGVSDIANLHQVFTDHTWVLGNRWPNEEPLARARFCSELYSALTTINASAVRPCTLFMYCGSIQVAEVVESVLVDFPFVSAVINLFYTYDHSLANEEYRARYAPSIERLFKHTPQIQLVAPTQQVVDEYTAFLSITLPKLPHPSTTFDDAAARSAPFDYHRPDTAQRKFRVYFPVSVREDKGFLKIPEIVEYLTPDDHYAFTVRDSNSPDISEDLRDALATLKDQQVTIGPANLTLRQYIEWISLCDIMVLAYPPSTFANRTSGLLIDALVLGIPVVVVNGTWLAEEVITHQTGLAVSEAADAIADAVRYISLNYEAFVSNAREAAKAHLVQNNWDALLKLVLQPQTQPPQPKNLPSNQFRLQVALKQLQSWAPILSSDDTSEKRLQDQKTKTLVQENARARAAELKLDRTTAQMRLEIESLEFQLELLNSMLDKSTSANSTFTQSAMAKTDPLISDAALAWQQGDWARLVNITCYPLESMDQKPVLALFAAIGAAQTGDAPTAREFLSLSLEWGATESTVHAVLSASTLSSLARVKLLAQDEASAQSLTRKAFDQIGFGAATNQQVDLRLTSEKISLGLLSSVKPDMASQLEALLNKRIIRSTHYQAFEKQLELLSNQLALHQARSLGTTSSREAISSFSQLGQDLWVLKMTDFKHGGYFVEFGATDGILLSNTYLLERNYAWSGLCSEPNPKFFRRLQVNRNCKVSMDCVTAKTGTIERFILADEYGGIESQIDHDKHAGKRHLFRDIGAAFDVETITLNDFLIKHGAPRDIDYVSIDTEGSEYDILKDFPFHEWRIKLFTVEHNFASFRQDLIDLMCNAGYSHQPMQFDDWFFRQ